MTRWASITWAHYNGYLYALRTLASQLHIPRDTQWRISEESYALISDAFYAMLLMGNDLDHANSLCGRHPFGSRLPIPSTSYRQLVETSTPVLGARDTKLAAAYERVWQAGDLRSRPKLSRKAFGSLTQAALAFTDKPPLTVTGWPP